MCDYGGRDWSDKTISQCTPGATRRERNGLCRASGGSVALPTHCSSLLASRTVIDRFLLFYTTKFVVTCYSSHKETNTDIDLKDPKSCVFSKTPEPA